MPFSDLHLHPALKTQFGSSTNPVGLCELLMPSAIPPLPRLCSDFGLILSSQSNLSQLVANDVRLVCAALYAPESAITQARLLRSVRVPRFLNIDRLDELAGPAYAPFQTILAELRTMLNPCAGSGLSLRSLRQRSDFSDTAGVVNAVFTVEGCHSLVDSLADFDHPDTLAQIMIRNLDALAERATIFSINLTHFQNFGFCGQAFGIQFIEDNRFFPTGNGLSPAAWTLIRHCQEKRVLIDIKHMSVKARHDFQTQMATEGYPFPIICTHAGFTGIPVSEYHTYVSRSVSIRVRGDSRQAEVAKPKKYLGGSSQTAFNATSINLFDDDLVHILKSGGVVGISMDSRILGYNPRNITDDAADAFVRDIDVLSSAEIAIFGDLSRNGRGQRENPFNALQNQDTADDDLRPGPNNQFTHFQYFANHIIHLMNVAQQHHLDPIAALGQVCLGSDFDGLINPVTCTLTVEDYQRLRQQFIDFFPNLLRQATIGITLSGEQTAGIADGIFYTNARRFILNRLS
ncbi:membrane dipeptidase [Spirosoma spitsbergense]|uniref:membrane dipeptidase n=1 Tax=Spirosoma spitsbergense TaxID=431554 RepID=UPI000370EC2E|nr:membrane dipeptidase [Spirosoma spitsbergense]